MGDGEEGGGEGTGRGPGKEGGLRFWTLGLPLTEPRPSAQRRDASSVPRTRGVGSSGQERGLEPGLNPRP